LNLPPSEKKPRAKNHKQFRRTLASWSRWLHIYLSMFGLVAILFFSVTGLTLNHPDWFFAEQTKRVSGQIEAALLNQNGLPPQDWDENDYSHKVAKLEVAEYLRGQHRLTGSVSDFLAFEDQCEVTFEGPGYAATAHINRATGSYDLDITANDLVTMMNDLHKGRHTGFIWSLCIDATAIIGTLVGVSGFILIFFLKLRRFWGITVAMVGTAAIYWCYWVATS
jgi:uncharacterized protein